MRKNIYWDEETDKLAQRLAYERGISISELLRKLLKAEKDDARIAPSTPAVFDTHTPGFAAYLEKEGYTKKDAGQSDIKKASEKIKQALKKK